jgi:hypothetical protein
MEHVLVKNSKYCGRYVAIKDFDDPTIVSDGQDPQEVYERAIKKGYNAPVIIFVPLEDMVQIYKIDNR